MPDALLARLEAMDAKASPEPWYEVGLPWNGGPPWINAGSRDPHGGKPVCDFSMQEDHDDGTPEMANRDFNDAALIVAIRNSLPALIAYVRAADALVAMSVDMMEALTARGVDLSKDMPQHVGVGAKFVAARAELARGIGEGE